MEIDNKVLEVWGQIRTRDFLSEVEEEREDMLDREVGYQSRGVMVADGDTDMVIVDTLILDVDVW